MIPAFTDRWASRFRSVYADTALVDVPWFTAAPGLKLMEAVVGGLIPRGSRVVDMGCGPGCNAVFLATAGALVTGIDNCAEALGKARALAEWAGVDVTFSHASILDTGLASESAEFVNDSFVFHNLTDEARAPYVAEILRVLRPGGCFILNSFSDKMVEGSGPRRITSGEIFDTFGPGQFECRHLEIYSNLPTPARPDQKHWFGVFRSRRS